MAYKLLKGEFHIFYPDQPLNGPEPDGDTLKFRPDNPGTAEVLWRPGLPQPAFNEHGMINLRFEGLDALETHFAGRHQNLGAATSSRDFLLARAGFGNVTFNPGRPNKIASVERHPVRGHVLSNGLDGHGRIVAFVFFSDAPEPDGAEVFLDEARLGASYNVRSLAEGQAYPLFYLSLPISLKVRLAEIARAARASQAGLYASDASAPGATFAVSPATIGYLVIWPKLFRRLASYFGDAFADLSGFDAWLRRDPRNRDDRLLLPDEYDAHMHNIIEVLSHGTMRLRADPADVVVVPDDFVMPETGLRSH